MKLKATVVEKNLTKYAVVNPGYNPGYETNRDGVIATFSDKDWAVKFIAIHGQHLKLYEIAEND